MAIKLVKKFGKGWGGNFYLSQWFLTMHDDSNIQTFGKLGLNLCEQEALEQQAQQEVGEIMASRDDRGSREQLVLPGLKETPVHQVRRDSAVSEAVLGILAARALLDSLVVQGLLAFWDYLVQVGLLDLLVVLELPDQLGDRAVKVYQVRWAGLEIKDRPVHLDRSELWELPVLLDRLVTPASLDLWVSLVRKELLDSVVSICHCVPSSQSTLCITFCKPQCSDVE